MSIYTILANILFGLNIFAGLGWWVHFWKIKDKKNEVNGINYIFSGIFMLFIATIMGLYYMIDNTTGTFLSSILNFAFGVLTFQEAKRILYKLFASLIIMLSCIILISSSIQLCI